MTIIFNIFSRIEAILKCLGQSTDLAKKIALNKGKYNRLSKSNVFSPTKECSASPRSKLLNVKEGISSISDSWYKKIAQETNVEVNIQGIVGNNEYQKKAIKKALVSPFTLIHGPPGINKCKLLNF